MKTVYDVSQKVLSYREAEGTRLDPRVVRLTILAAGLSSGLLFLLVGLFWTQVLSGRRYGSSLERQTVRQVRIPAIRGNILDRNGLVLATNRPSYSIVLYVEELRRQRKQATEKETVRVTRETIQKIAEQLRLPLPVTDEQIYKHIQQALPVPLELWKDISTERTAIFVEKCSEIPGADLQITTTREYPFGSLAAHVLGYVQKTEGTPEGDEREFHYSLPDMAGKIGLELKFDEELRGSAGARALLIDAAGFRRQNLGGDPMQPGRNLVVSLDARLQYEVEKILGSQSSPGACVVVDPRNGDVLAAASYPTFDPNWFAAPLSSVHAEEWQNREKKIQWNRAVRETYEAGSIFKMVVSLAGLESGVITANSHVNCQGQIKFSNGEIKRCWSSAGHGDVGLTDALKHSCDVFFYQYGIEMGPRRISEMAQQFFLGESTGIALPSEASGSLPGTKNGRTVAKGWFQGDTANFSVGQGSFSVTPLQMAVMTATLANGGQVYVPRLVQKLQAMDENGQPTGKESQFPIEERGIVNVSAFAFEKVRQAMLRVVEDVDGTGHRAAVSGIKIAGKTGTAEHGYGDKKSNRVWFVAFAPYESPRYAVAMMLENGDHGGTTVGPMVGQMFENIFHAKHEEGGRSEGTGD